MEPLESTLSSQDLSEETAQRDGAVTSIVIVDNSLSSPEILSAASENDAHVYVLDPDQGGISQVTEILEDYSGIDSLHIVSHGGSGYLSLGADIIQADTLDYYAKDLNTWQKALSQNADILLYGCSVGRGEDGLRLVDNFAAHTGADIAASTDLTGAADLQGDWDLELKTGEIESAIIEASGYQGTLGTYTVTNLNDSGAGSLRQAIIDSNTSVGADTIQFATSLNGTINLQSKLVIEDDLTIIGSGASRTILDGSGFTNSGSIIDVNVYDKAITLKGMTVANNSKGGGIYAYGQSLVAEHLVLHNNAGTGIDFSGANWDTGIYDGTLSVYHSTFTDNRNAIVSYYHSNTTVGYSTITGNATTWYGAGFVSSNEYGASSINYTTITGNSQSGSGASGGGIYVMGADVNAITLNHSVVSGNSATNIGGLSFSGSGTINLNSSIVANNTDDDGNVQIDSIGVTVVNTDSIIGATTYTLDPLAQNGGPVETISLPNGSSAIDAGQTHGFTYDARGYLLSSGGTPDAGAYESNATQFTYIGYYFPCDDHSSVDGDTNLVMDFGSGMALAAGSGNIYIKQVSGNSVVETIDVTDTGKVTFSNGVVTINPGVELSASTSYYVEIDSGAFTDGNGATFTGISGSTTWNFTVDPSWMVSNQAPTVSGTTASVTVTEDTASNINLSSLVFADADDTNLTVTITIDSGTFSSPANGSGVGGGVTATLVNSQKITLAGAKGDINTYLDTASNIKYTGPANVSGNGAATITIEAADSKGGVLSSNPTVDINITGVNDNPVNNGSFPSDITVIEDTAGNVDLSGIELVDADPGDTLTLNLTATGGTLSAGDSGGVTVGGSGSGILTLQGSAANINNYLDTASNIKYTGPSNANGQDAYTIAVKVSDDNGSGDVALGTVNIDITAVNDAPTVSGTPTDVTVPEDTESNIDLSGVAFADVDGDSLTVTISADSGTFSAPADGSGTGSGVTETLVDSKTITLAGAAADINTYLDTASNIKYTGAANAFGDDAAVITLQASDGSDPLASNPTVNVDITAVDDAPTQSGLPDVTGFDGIAKNLDLSATTISDVDSAGLTVTISVDSGTLTAGAAGGTHGASGAVVVQTDPATVTLTGTSTQITNYLDDTSELSFTGASLGSATLTLFVDDAVNPASTDTATITVVDGDTPGAATDTYSGTEDTAVDLATAGMAATQDGAVNDALDFITITEIAGGSLALTGSPSATGAATAEAMAPAGSVSVGDKISTADIALLEFTPTANATAAGTVKYTVTDAGDDVSDEATITINLAAVNDAPTVSGTPTDVTVPEDTESDIDLSGVAFDDVDGDSLTVTISADSGTFSAPADGSGTGSGVTEALVDSKTITLTGAAADINTYLDTASNIKYTGAANAFGDDAAVITLQASDGSDPLAFNPTVNVDITAVDDSPTQSGLNGTSAILGVAKDLDLSATTISDVDSAGLTVTISVNSGTLTAGAAGGTHGASGAVVAQTDSATVTLTGTPAEITGYLDDTSELSFTSGTEAGNVILTLSVDDNVNPAVSNTAVIAVADLDAPSATDADKAGTEDISFTMTTSEIVVAQEANGTDALEYITIQSVSGGTLALTGAPAAGTATDGSPLATAGPLSGGSKVNVNDLTLIEFTPTLNSTAGGSVEYTVTDAGSDESSPATLTITLAGTSDAPEGADKYMSIHTGQSHTFKASDFGFSDPDTGDGLNRVQVNTQSLDNGALRLNNTAVADGDWIALSDIGSLIYSPSAVGTDTFTFTVEDDSSANETDSTPNTITINVTSPPTPQPQPEPEPEPEPQPEPEPEPEPDEETTTETVDGVTVTTETKEVDGNVVTTVRVDPTPPDRVDEVGSQNDNLADVPLQYGDTDKETAQTIVSLPVGVGLVAEGGSTPKTAEEAINELISLTNSTVPDADNSKDDMLNGARDFLLDLAEKNSNLVVNSVVFTTADAADQISEPIQVTGTTPDSNGGVSEALVIDASNLPPGTQLNLSDVDFAVIIGPATLRGGEGSNIIYAGEGSQNIVLGEDDDELYGGPGDDVVGSEGGNDSLFGNSGNDTLFGGEGADFIHGGEDNDIVLFEGNIEDYIFEQVYGVVTVTSKSDPNDVDTLINIETLQFDDGEKKIAYTQEMTQIATLYGQVLNRQADLGGFQHWADTYHTGMTVSDIAVKFLTSAEAEGMYNMDIHAISNETAVDYLYQALLGRDGDEAGKAYWVSQMDNGHSFSQVTQGFVYSEEFALYGVPPTDWEFFV